METSTAYPVDKHGPVARSEVGPVLPAPDRSALVRLRVSLGVLGIGGLVGRGNGRILGRVEMGKSLEKLVAQ